MHSYTRWSKPGLLAAIAVGMMLASCGGPEYTYFRVHVTAQDSSDPATGLENLYKCYMTVQNSWGNTIVDEYPLKKTSHMNGDVEVLDQGCAGPLTKANAGEIGYFGYSTSRTVHEMVFKVEGRDNSNAIIQSGTGGPRPIPCPSEFIDHVDGACTVDVVMAP
jgi:hypothetical protein